MDATPRTSGDVVMSAHTTTATYRPAAQSALEFSNREIVMPDMFQVEPLRFEHVDLASLCDEEFVVDVAITDGGAQLFIEHRVESEDHIVTTPYLDPLDLRRFARVLMNAAAELERAKYQRLGVYFTDDAAAA
jgi:hypothetical protein